MRLDARPPLILALALILAGLGLAAAPTRPARIPDYQSYIAPKTPESVASGEKLGLGADRPLDSRAVGDQTGPAQLRDAQGNVVGVVTPLPGSPIEKDAATSPTPIIPRTDNPPRPEKVTGDPPHMPPAEVIDLSFDLSLLPPEEIPPPPVPIEPPPDPMKGLKTYSYVGSVASGDEARAMFAGPAGVQILIRGMSLEGFTLDRFDLQSAQFSNGGASYVMRLGASN